MHLPADINHSRARLSSTILHTAVFVAGMTTLAVEFSTNRLVASVYGSSNIVWAAVIGMTLLYLMLGYYLGGRWADRTPSILTFYKLTAWTGFGLGVVPLVALPVLRIAGIALVRIDVGLALSAAVAVAILFVIPMTLLGCLPPFAIRLAVLNVADSGQAAGRVYALSAAGGVLGAFGSVLVLIPWIGSPGTIAAYAAVLMLSAIAGLSIHNSRQSWKYLWMPAALGFLLALGLRHPLRPAPPGTTLLYEKETRYNYVQVIELQDQTRILLLNEGLAIHSTYNPHRLMTGQSWDYFLAAPYFNTPPYEPDRIRKVALIGLAAGTVARQYTAVYGPVEIDGVEIDPGVVEAGRLYFDMNMANLNVIVEDGRVALGRLGGGYQMIGVDAYRPPYIPWQLTTLEFFAEVRRHLADDGVVIINVGRTYTDRRLVEAMTSTLLQVFSTVLTMDVPGSLNTMLVATVAPTRIENLQENIDILGNGISPFLRSSLDLAQATLVPTISSGLIFTDDRAPVEMISDALVVRFYLEGGASSLPSLGN